MKMISTESGLYRLKVDGDIDRVQLSFIPRQGAVIIVSGRWERLDLLFDALPKGMLSEEVVAAISEDLTKTYTTSFFLRGEVN
jgi:hypothetical protein